jgi:hypothetical protein
VNLTVLPLADGDLKPRLSVLEPEKVDLGRTRLIPVVQNDPGSKRIQHALVGLEAELGHVSLRHAPRRMQQGLCEIAVIGHEQRTAGVEVEPANRIDALSYAREQLRERGSTLGVLQRRDHPARLVHQIVHQRFPPNSRPRYFDSIPHRVGLGTEFGDDLTVDAHLSREDELLRSTARRNARVGKQLLQTFYCHDPQAGFVAGAAERSLPRRIETSRSQRSTLPSPSTSVPMRTTWPFS